jgi:uncharacterized protein YdaU (DUF1376 family)
MSHPWMPFYVKDYLGDTAHLSTLEHGAYLLLIMHYWQHSGLPDDDRSLALIAKLGIRQWASIRSKIAQLFGPGWIHKRIEGELEKANKKSDARVSAGSLGGLAKALKNSNPDLAKASVLLKQKKAFALASSTEPDSIPSSLRYEGINGADAPSRTTKPKTRMKSIAKELPGDWRPSDDDVAYGTSRCGLKAPAIEAFAEDMRLWAKAKGAKKIDWGAAFKGWMRREAQRAHPPNFGPRQNGNGRPLTTSEVFGAIAARAREMKNGKQGDFIEGELVGAGGITGNGH